MADLLKSTLIGLAVLVASWAVLVVLAARLPPGILKDLAGLLPACVTMLRRLRRDPRVPTRVKVVLMFAALWVISPIDLIPEFLPSSGRWMTWWSSRSRSGTPPGTSRAKPCSRHGSATRSSWIVCSEFRSLQSRRARQLAASASLTRTSSTSPRPAQCLSASLRESSAPSTIVHDAVTDARRNCRLDH